MANFLKSLFVKGIEIDTAGAVTGDVLKYDGSKFGAASAGSGGSNVGALDDLSDVVIASPEKGQTLYYDGSGWINEYPTTVTNVSNAESTTLTVGTIVYLFGGTGNHASVKRADNSSDTTSSKTMGIVSTAITAGGNGPVVTRGYVSGIDLSSGYSAGDVLWLGSNGAFTKTKTTAPNHLVFVGVVVRATNNGIIYVATQNGYELDELHNVSASSPSTNDIIVYDGSVWKNSASASLASLTVDTNTLYVDATNDRVGIGTTTPAETLEVHGTISAPSNMIMSEHSYGSTQLGMYASYNGVQITKLVGTTVDVALDLQSDRLNLKDYKTGEEMGFNLSLGMTAKSVFTNNIYLGNALTDGVPTAYTTSIGSITLTGNRAINFPNVSGTLITTGDTGTVTSTMIADSTIVNADISASAAISISKLESGTSAQVIIANSSGVPTYTTISGDITISNTGVATIASNSVALGTDTTGDYVGTITAGTGISSTGATTGEGTAHTISLASGVATAGTYKSVTVDTYGRVTSGSNPTTLSGYGITDAQKAITLSDSAPSSPAAGDFWFKTSTGTFYVYYDSFWVEVGFPTSGNLGLDGGSA